MKKLTKTDAQEARFDMAQGNYQLTPYEQELDLIENGILDGSIQVNQSSKQIILELIGKLKITGGSVTHLEITKLKTAITLSQK